MKPAVPIVLALALSVALPALGLEQRLGYTQFEELYSQSLYRLRGADDNIWEYSTFSGEFSKLVFGWCAQSCQGSQAPQEVTLKRVGPDGEADGRPFSLHQVRAAPRFKAGDDEPITVHGYRGGSSGESPVVTQRLTLSGTPGNEITYTLTGFTGLTRITFEKADPNGEYYDAALTELVFCAPGTDADADQVCDDEDDFPKDRTENTDSDGDGYGDNEEVAEGTDPNDPDDYPLPGLNIILLKAAIDAQDIP